MVDELFAAVDFHFVCWGVCVGGCGGVVVVLDGGGGGRGWRG
jgi:hypothetical protein